VAAVAPLSVRVVEEQRDEEEAVEHARSNFVAYHPGNESPLVPALALLILALGAGAGAGALRVRRRPRGEAAYARIDVRRERRW
jgi:hypothetical protein